jgi:hypothetical protein
LLSENFQVVGHYRGYVIVEPFFPENRTIKELGVLPVVTEGVTEMPPRNPTMHVALPEPGPGHGCLASRPQWAKVCRETEAAAVVEVFRLAPVPRAGGHLPHCLSFQSFECKWWLAELGHEHEDRHNVSIVDLQ